MPPSRTLACAAALALVALSAGCSNAPKQCRTDPKGYICRAYKQKKIQKQMAEREKEMRLHPPKPHKFSRKAKPQQRNMGAKISVSREEHE